MLKFSRIERTGRSNLLKSPAKELFEGDVEIAKFDLDGDGTPEIILMSSSLLYCGSGGCTVWVLAKKGKHYVSLLNQSMNPEDICVTKEKIGKYKALCISNENKIATGQKLDTLMTGEQLVYPLNDR